MNGKSKNIAYVTSKGRLVVPLRIRRRFGIKPGTRVNFVEENGRIIFQPVTRKYINSFCGIFKLKPGEKSVVQEHLEERRAERNRENRKRRPPVWAPPRCWRKWFATKEHKLHENRVFQTRTL